MKQFEYKKVHQDLGISESELNAYGKDGWELVVEFDFTWIFKREIPRKPSKDTSVDLYEDWGG